MNGIFIEFMHFSVCLTTSASHEMCSERVAIEQLRRDELQTSGLLVISVCGFLLCLRTLNANQFDMGARNFVDSNGHVRFKLAIT